MSIETFGQTAKVLADAKSQRGAKRKISGRRRSAKRKAGGRRAQDRTKGPQPGMKLLRGLGFKTAAMALSDNAVSIDDPRLAAEERLAVILGTEGGGLAAWKTMNRPASCFSD